MKSFTEMKTLIQVGAGPNGLLQAIHTLKKHHGKINYKIFEKRPLDDLDKLTTLLFLKKAAIEQLEPEIIEELLTPDPATGRPMAYRQVDAFFKVEVMPVHIADLERVLIQYLKNKFQVEIQRNYDLVDLEKLGDQNFAKFLVKENGNQQPVRVQYDLCTLSMGSRAAKDFSEKVKNQTCNIDVNYRLYHQTPVIIGRFPLQKNYTEIKSAQEYADKLLMQVLPLDEQNSYAGLMVTPKAVGFLATTSWENARLYKKDVKARQEKIYSVLNSLQVVCPQITEAIGNNLPSFSDVVLAEKSLSNSIIADYNGIITGDMLTVSPFFYGNELNHSITRLLPIYDKSVDAIVEAKTHNEVTMILKAHAKDTDSEIQQQMNYQFHLLVDPFGHTLTPSGKKEALLPQIKHRLMPAGTTELLPPAACCCASAVPYVTWLGIKMGNLMPGNVPPSLSLPAPNARL